MKHTVPAQLVGATKHRRDVAVTVIVFDSWYRTKTCTYVHTKHTQSILK
jgi:hypothetical protein